MPRRYPLRDALVAGYRLFRAGQDVVEGLNALGYARDIAQATWGRIQYEESGGNAPPLQQHSQSQGLEEAAMSSVKRQRRGGPEAPVAKPVKKFVKKCMDKAIETKFIENTQTATNIADSGTIVQCGLFNIVQGATDAGRTGNQIRVTRLTYRLTLTDTVMSVIRCILVWDRQPNGAAATVANVCSGANFNSGYNKDYVVGHGGSRFAIVADFTRVINPPITLTNTPSQINKVFKQDKVVTFGGTAVTIADMATNNLFWIFWASSGATDLSGNVEIRYKDG